MSQKCEKNHKFDKLNVCLVDFKINQNIIDDFAKALERSHRN